MPLPITIASYVAVGVATAPATERERAAITDGSTGGGIFRGNFL